MADNTFCAEERLKSHVTIGRLFKEGHSFGMYPLRVVWLPVEAAEGAYPAQFALTVPKRSFKKAVDRNRLRRKIREAYRLNKAAFYQHLPPKNEEASVQYALMVIYTAKKSLPYATIQEAMLSLLQKLTRKIGPSSNPTQVQ